MRSKALFLALVSAATLAAPLAVTGNATAGTNPNITAVGYTWYQTQA